MYSGSWRQMKREEENEKEKEKGKSEAMEHTLMYP